MIVFGVLVLMVVLLVALIVSDIRQGATAIAIFEVHSKEQPIAYWSILLVWLIGLIYCGLMAMGAFLADRSCDGKSHCVLIVEVREPGK